MGIYDNGTTNNGKDARRKWVGMKFIKLDVTDETCLTI